MSQGRLNGLAILCIENDISEHLDYGVIIDDFAAQNTRRSHFNHYILTNNTVSYMLE
ncbi:hypothetical protein LguiB_027124 [Lonicera macranthoides]